MAPELDHLERTVNATAPDLGALLVDLLKRRMQVRFSQSAGERVGAWPPVAGDHTKCWVRLEGYGELAASEWRSSPAAALVEAHDRAIVAMRPTLGEVLYACAQQTYGHHTGGDSRRWVPFGTPEAAAEADAQWRSRQ